MVREGMLNVERLPITTGKGTLKQLKDKGLAGCIETDPASVTLDLASIPIINRAIAEQNTSALALASLVRQELECEAALKVYKHFKESLDPDGKLEKAVFTPEQAEFLIKCGITKNGFAPPVEMVEPTDHYLAKEFEIKAKGFSSWPKVDGVLKKIAEGKKLTPSEDMMAVWVNNFDRNVAQPNLPTEASIGWLNSQIGTITTALRTIRSSIQRTKFAVLLGKKWFSEFATRDNCTLNVGDLEFSFSVKEVEIKI